MHWIELKSSIKTLLLSRNLAKPQIRLNALDRLEGLLKSNFPEIIKNPENLLIYNKIEFKEKISEFKKLNSAESSIINNFYQILSSEDTSTASILSNLNKIKSIKSSKINDNNHLNTENKLKPIAELIAELLREKFHIEPKFMFEATNNWLLNSPSNEIHRSKWEKISDIYSLLVEGEWDLDTRISEFEDQINLGFQKIDIWFSDPFNFIVEFDETQHFNQFRLITLENYANYENSPFDLQQYLDISKSRIVKPGISGFHKLKSFDPLFPPISVSDKQINRPIQRAFRDFLKDITPTLKGFNKTLRISYKTTNGKIKDFNEQDLNNIKSLIMQNNYLDKINLGSISC